MGVGRRGEQHLGPAQAGSSAHTGRPQRVEEQGGECGPRAEQWPNTRAGHGVASVPGKSASARILCSANAPLGAGEKQAFPNTKESPRVPLVEERPQAQHGEEQLGHTPQSQPRVEPACGAHCWSSGRGHCRQVRAESQVTT